MARNHESTKWPHKLLRPSNRFPWTDKKRGLNLTWHNKWAKLYHIPGLKIVGLCDLLIRILGFFIISSIIKFFAASPSFLIFESIAFRTFWSGSENGHRTSPKNCFSISSLMVVFKLALCSLAPSQNLLY